MVNENNYPGANVTVVGYAAYDAGSPAYDKSGERGITEVTILVNEGFKQQDGTFKQTGVTRYQHTSTGQYAEASKSVRKGDLVRIDDAKQEVREYQKDGENRLGINLRFGTVTVIKAKDQSNDLVAAGASTETPW